MKTKNKLIKLIIGFLLIFPFRLPISILLIQAFDYIIGLTSNYKDIPVDVICTNVIVTKVIYNIAVGIWLIYLIETYSIEMKGRKAKHWI